MHSGSKKPAGAIYDSQRRALNDFMDDTAAGGSRGDENKIWPASLSRRKQITSTRRKKTSTRMSHYRMEEDEMDESIAKPPDCRSCGLLGDLPLSTCNTVPGTNVGQKTTGKSNITMWVFFHTISNYNTYTTCSFKWKHNQHVTSKLGSYESKLGIQQW